MIIRTAPKALPLAGCGAGFDLAIGFSKVSIGFGFWTIGSAIGAGACERQL